MKKRKILSIMLVFLMMISFLPTNIYANDETKNIGQLSVTTYEQLKNGLGDAADVSRDADGHINIKLNKNLKGQLKLEIRGAYYVFEQHNHVYNQEVESSKYLKQAATCVTPGIYYKSCTCGAKSNSEFYTGHLGHDYTVKVKKEAYLKSKAKDCTEHDVYWYVCSRCGKTSTTLSYADLDSKVDHVSSDWIIDKEATLESDGSKHKECTVCKEVLETEKIAKLENKATVTPTVKKEEIKTETKTATQAVKTGDNTNIIEVVCLLVFSLVVLTFVRKYC